MFAQRIKCMNMVRSSLSVSHLILDVTSVPLKLGR